MGASEVADAVGAHGKGCGLLAHPSARERPDAVLRDSLDLREAVLAAQDVPGRSKQQCFAGVRAALVRSAEISDLSPVAAAVLAEIQLHIGQPSLPAVSRDHALPAGSFDADAWLEEFLADDLEPEGLCARGSSMQELAVIPFALDHAGQVFVAEVGKEGSTCSGALPEVQEPVELSSCSRVCLSSDSALGQAECEPESWHSMVVPQGLFVQFSVWREVVLSGRVCVGPICEKALPGNCSSGDFFRRYGKVHIEYMKEVGSRDLVTFEHAHQARAAQWDCDDEPVGEPGEFLHRVQFLGLVSWPGTNNG